MPSPLAHHAAAQVARRVPLLRKLPIVRLLILGEMILLARSHYERLSPRERRRLVVLLRDAKGRPSNLSSRQRRELEAIIAKADPSGLVASAAARLRPI